MQQRVALVTGGARGIGAATSAALARDGWDVVVGYRQRADAADAVVAACREQGVQAVAVKADVSVPADVDRLFERADGLGPLRGLVNNAGVVPPPGTVAGTDAGRLHDVLAVNVVGAFLVAAQAVRRMTDGGVVVNVSSRAAVLGAAGEYVDYAASKAAVDALTVGLAGEVAAQGVRVVGVRPGLIDTEVHAAGRLERLRGSTLLGRAGTADEVAATIAWLMSDAASYVTGTTLDVSGGR